MRDLQNLLELSSRHHRHLCPRQILGVRLGLAGLAVLGFNESQPGKRLLVFLESDGCFADGVISATNCTIGHRTLRVEDYGKTAATFVDAKTGVAIRVAPRLDIRERACSFVQDEPRPYYAQLQAYQTIPDEEMFSVQEVTLQINVEQIVSRPGLRVSCDLCGEEIINEREIHHNGLTLCQPCARPGYYIPAEKERLSLYIRKTEEAVL